MKKLLLILMCLLLVGCITFDEVEYIGDAYYPDRGYFETGGGGVSFRTLNGTDKVIIIYRESFNNIVTVSRNDKVLFKFADGKEIALSYTSRVSQYDNGDFLLTARSGVIKEFGTLKMIRVTTDDGYNNIGVGEGGAEHMIREFNLIQAAATAKYGNKENIEAGTEEKE